MLQAPQGPGLEMLILSHMQFFYTIIEYFTNITIMNMKPHLGLGGAFLECQENTGVTNMQKKTTEYIRNMPTPL